MCTIIVAFFIIIEIAAVLLAIPAHVINVVYRNYITIKASSYRLNQFVFVGCYLIIIGAVLYTLSETIELHTTTDCSLQHCTMDCYGTYLDTGYSVSQDLAAVLYFQEKRCNNNKHSTDKG